MILHVDDCEDVVGRPFEEWAHCCHEVSLAIVKNGMVDGGRVARGTCRGVGGQHSWICVGDPYGDVAIIDPTLWSYRSDIVGIWHGRSSAGWHRPHGAGSIWEYGCPSAQGGPIIELVEDPGREGRLFLDICGPLDRHGWSVLLHAPLEGWPSKAILTAAAAQPELAVLIPIDHLGNGTDLNPEGLYW